MLSQPLAAEQLKDPMRPPEQGAIHTATGEPRSFESRYRLDSVIIAPNRRLAIINGRKLALGDRIDHARLVAVHATEVTLSIAGKTHVLSLLPLSIKTLSSEAKRQ